MEPPWDGCSSTTRACRQITQPRAHRATCRPTRSPTPSLSARDFTALATDRRAMPLVNLRYHQAGAILLGRTRLATWRRWCCCLSRARIEMGQDIKRVVDTSGARHDVSRALRARLWRSTRLPIRRSAKALAQFVRALVSYQSRYDEGRARARSARDDFDNFTLQENRGKALFMRNCTTCHMKDANEHFFVPTPANTGLRRADLTADAGVGDVTLRDARPGLVQVAVAPERRGNRPIRPRRTLRDARRADRSLQ